MSMSPDAYGESPEPEMSRIRVNLDSQFLSSMQDCIQVYARVRPLLPEETAAGFKECIAAIDEQTVRALVPASSNKGKSNRNNQEIMEDFTFTTAFGPEVNQFVFFEETMMQTMQNFMEGRNSLVFSYGITGSGKTYTLQGNADNPGITPISLKLFFSAIEDQILCEPIVKPDKFSDVLLLTPLQIRQEIALKDRVLSMYEIEDTSILSSSTESKKSFAMTLCELFSDKFDHPQRETTLPTEDMMAAQAASQMKEISKRCVEQMEGRCCIWVSFIEIYNEIVYDLLQPISKKRMGLSYGEDNGDVFIKGVQQVFVSNSDEALQLLMIGRKNLKIASTKLNYQSSRSHCIYTLKVVRIPSEKDISWATVNWLSICDLAGSERSGKAGTHGERLKEASSINRSLLILHRCMEKLRSNQTLREKQVVPFRESKLTRLFSSFFMGKGKAVMIVNASPSEFTFDETLHVLKFSAVAKQILVNDHFIESASSTLQSITNKWSHSRQNQSESFVSAASFSADESYDELVEEKDEIINKLLTLAESLKNKLLKEREEKSELEFNLRQDILKEYSEDSDNYLKNQQEYYEEELRELRKIHEDRIAEMHKTCKAYEDIIKQYEEQVEDESLDESLDKSKDDLQDKNMTMSENSLKDKLAKRAEFQKYLMENEDLSKVGSPYSTSHAKVKDSRSVIEGLELKIAQLNCDLLKTKGELENVQANSTNLENEICQYKDKISCLEAENLQLSTHKNDQIILKCMTDKSILEDRLTNSLKELNEMEATNLKLKEELAASEKYKSEVLCLKKEKSILEDNFSAVSKELTEVKEKFESVNIKLTETSDLCEDYKTKLILLKEFNSKMENEQIAGLSSELDSAEERLQARSSMEEAFEQRLAALKESCESKDKEIFILQESLIENISTISSLNEEMNEVNNLLNKCGIDVETKRNSNLKSEPEKNDELLCSFSSKLNELMIHVVNFKQGVFSVKELFSLKKAEISNLKKSEVELNCALTSASQKLKKLSFAHEDTKRILDGFKSSCSLKDEEISKLKTALDVASSDLSHTLERCELPVTERISLQCSKALTAGNELKNQLNESKQEGQNEIQTELKTISSACEGAEREKATLKSPSSSNDEKYSALQKSLDELHAKLKEKSFALEEAENESVTWKSTCSKQTEEVSNLQKSLDELNCTLTATKKTLQELSFAHEETEKKLDSFKSSCSSKDEEISKLKTALGLASSSHDLILILEMCELRATEKIKRISSQCSKVLAEYNELKSQNEEKQKRLKNEMDAKVNELSSACEKAEKEISTLKNTCCSKDLQFSTLQKSSDALHAKLIEKSLALEEAENELGTWKSTCSMQKEEISNLQKSLDELHTEVKEKSLALGEVKNEVVTLKSTSSMQKEEISNLQKCSDELHTEVKEKSLALGEAKNEVITLKSTCSMQKEEISNLQKSIDELLTEVKEKSALGEAKNEVITLKSTCSMQKEEISNLQKSIDIKDSLIEILEKSEFTAHKKCKEAILDAQEKHSTLVESAQKKYADMELHLSEECKRLKIENNALKEENEKLRLNHNKIKAEFLELTNEMKQLKFKVPCSEHKTFQKETKSSSNILKETKNQVYSMKDQENVEETTRKSKRVGIKKKSSAEACDISSRISSLRIRHNKMSYSEESPCTENSSRNSKVAQKKKVSAEADHDSDFDIFEPQKKVQRRKKENDPPQASSNTRRNIVTSQQLADFPGSRLKAVSNNIAKSMPSPRLTRGKRKLFNTDAAH